jgi:hypothetical protein
VTDSGLAGQARSWQPEHQEESKMNMTCTWVRADDGALVMKWTKAGDPDLHWEAGDDVEFAFEVLDQRADALTPIGV